jgi:hypothetical protein
VATEADLHALKAWNLLRSGDSSSFDWNGLPLVAGLLGIDDVEGLVTRLQAIKTYARKKDDQ